MEAELPDQPGTSNANGADSNFDYGDYTTPFQSHRFWPAWSDNSNSTGDNPDGTLHQFALYTQASRSHSGVLLDVTEARPAEPIRS